MLQHCLCPVSAVTRETIDSDGPQQASLRCPTVTSGQTAAGTRRNPDHGPNRHLLEGSLTPWQPPPTHSSPFLLALTDPDTARMTLNDLDAARILLLLVNLLAEILRPCALSHPPWGGACGRCQWRLDAQVTVTGPSRVLPHDSQKTCSEWSLVSLVSTWTILAKATF